MNRRILPRKRTILLGVGMTLFICSFLLCVYAGYQIVAERKAVQLFLTEWDRTTWNNPSDRIQDKLEVQELIGYETEHMDNSNSEESLQAGSLLGKMTIDRLNRDLPIIHGTRNEELKLGVGHFVGSAFPGESGHTVLAGHRQTVFQGLGELEKGDLIRIETHTGLFTYSVQRIFIVEQDDRNVLVEQDEPLLTLITCYPFQFVGPAPQRYIIQATLVQEKSTLSFVKECFFAANPLV